MLGLLLDGGVRGEPLAEDGVGHFGGAVEVDVHVPSQRLHLHVDVQLGVGHAGKGPDDVGALAIVPADGLREERAGV